MLRFSLLSFASGFLMLAIPGCQLLTANQLTSPRNQKS